MEGKMGGNFKEKVGALQKVSTFRRVLALMDRQVLTLCQEHVHMYTHTLLKHLDTRRHGNKVCNLHTLTGLIGL